MSKSKKKKDNVLNKRMESELAISPSIPPQEEYYTRIKHFANLGDIVASLASVKKYHDITRRKVIYCQQVNQKAAYYQGAVHPTVDERGENVCVNQPMFDMMKPLVESQPYIHKMERYEGQPIDLDFDVIRGKTFVGLPNLMLQSWIAFAFPDLAYDYSKPWIELPDVADHPLKKEISNKVIINFTERYRNDVIDYYFLKYYMPDLVFAGTEREYYLFTTRWALTIPRLQINNFLEYAYAIKYSKFILGNQSLGWNIAQAMGTPRIVELCRFAPNVQPGVGENSYGYFHQIGAEYYFRKLYNETNK